MREICWCSCDVTGTPKTSWVARQGGQTGSPVWAVTAGLSWCQHSHQKTSGQSTTYTILHHLLSYQVEGEIRVCVVLDRGCYEWAVGSHDTCAPSGGKTKLRTGDWWGYLSLLHKYQVSAPLLHTTVMAFLCPVRIRRNKKKKRKLEFLYIRQTFTCLLCCYNQRFRDFNVGRFLRVKCSYFIRTKSVFPP